MVESVFAAGQLKRTMGIFDRFLKSKSAATAAGLPDNSRLVKAMVSLGKKDSEKNRRALHVGLVTSTLIVATTEVFDPNAEAAPAKKKAKKKAAKKAKKKSKAKNKADESVDGGAGLSLKIVKDEHGATVLPVFTDDGAFMAWYKEGSPFVALPAKDIFQLVLEHDLARIAINPAGPVWGTLSQADIQRLLFSGDG